jgi:hypothetical protein
VIGIDCSGQQKSKQGLESDIRGLRDGTSTSIFFTPEIEVKFTEPWTRSFNTVKLCSVKPKISNNHHIVFASLIQALDVFDPLSPQSWVTLLSNTGLTKFS